MRAYAECVRKRKIRWNEMTDGIEDMTKELPFGEVYADLLDNNSKTV